MTILTGFLLLLNNFFFEKVLVVRNIFIIFAADLHSYIRMQYFVGAKIYSRKHQGRYHLEQQESYEQINVYFKFA